MSTVEHQETISEIQRSPVKKMKKRKLNKSIENTEDVSIQAGIVISEEQNDKESSQTIEVIIPQSVVVFPKDLFIDRGQFYELNFPQRSQPWLDVRKKLVRVTASIFAQAAGMSPYKTRVRLLREMAGLITVEDANFMQKKAMAHGTFMEPYVRSWYERTYKKKAVERGLIVPKWCHRIGVSVDGYVEKSNSIIEIKCPVNMYPELVDISHRRANGEIFDKLYYKHIKPDHYCQMQGGMAILDTDYCDYIVFVGSTNDIHVERIYRNREFWDKELFPKLMSFVSDLDGLNQEKQQSTQE